MGRRAVVMIALSLVGVACGGPASPASSVAEPPATAEAPGDTGPAPSAVDTAAPDPEPPATTDETAPSSSRGVAAIAAGRGDDGSLEVAIWFASDPFGDPSARLVVGTDSDDSYPGVGDPTADLDGWIEIDATGIALFDGGEAVADEESGGLSDRFSWTGPGRVVRLYFIGTVPTRAGTLWVSIETGARAIPGAIGGVAVGAECSYRGGGVDLGSVPGDTPDPGVSCRYPLG